MVDHFSAASEKSEIFTNASSIECPTKPSDYTCPKVLELTKDELKKKICDYENVLTGVLTLVPETEKAETRCGAFKLIKQDVKSADDVIELPEKLAVVLGKECAVKKLFEASKKDGEQQDQILVLIKSAIPSGTKFMLLDGTDVDLASASIISKEEIPEIMKQCPKKQ